MRDSDRQKAFTFKDNGSKIFVLLFECRMSLTLVNSVNC